MKTRPTITRFALAAIGALALSPLTSIHAQQTTVTTSTASDGKSSTSVQTTATTGTFQQFSPGSSQLILQSTEGSPVTYSYSKRTTFVDAAGNTVSSETIKAGEFTTVYYAMENGQPVVSKVVVHRSALQPRATTTTTVEPATVVAPAAPVIQTEKTTTTTTTTGGK